MFHSGLASVWCLNGSWPVSIEERAGVQIAEGVKALVNRHPSAARESTFGVCAWVLPMHPRVSMRCWSVMKVMMLRTLSGTTRGLVWLSAMRSSFGWCGRCYEHGDTRRAGRTGPPEGKRLSRPFPRGTCRWSRADTSWRRSPPARRRRRTPSRRWPATIRRRRGRAARQGS